MKALSFSQVATCEKATKPRCRCRCEGAAHGIRRSGLPEFFEQLPEDDPHRIPERSRQLPLPTPIGAAA